MATIVLGAVGGLIGGTVGQFIGQSIGSVVDGMIFAPSVKREGPRLRDLSVQSSAYGEAVPLVFGRTRIAGNIIWSTGLQETRTTERRGGGKRGSVTTVTYHYSASFAVALAGRKIAGVGRVWADGKLIRDTAGHLNVGGQMRVYPGDERQEPDPLIEAAEGFGNTPAYRGLAYAVFERLELGEFANRIPLLTFEVIGDEGLGDAASPVPVVTIARALCGRAGVETTAGAAEDTLMGFAVGRAAPAGEALRALEALCPLYLADRGTGGAAVADRVAGEPVQLKRAHLGAAKEGKEEPRRRAARRGEAELPREVSIAYAEAGRDYQAGLQRARRLTAAGSSVERLELPAVLDAATAKQAAERLLARRWRRREPLEVAVPWQYLSLTPGDAIRMDGDADGLWQVRELTVEAGRLLISAVPVDAGDDVSTATAEPGRAPTQPGTPHGPTTLVVMDLPPLTATLPAGLGLHLAVAGASAGWRRASIAVSTDGGFDYDIAADVASRTVMGTAVSALPAGETALWDRHSTVTIALLADDMILESRSESAVLSGANLCLIGGEVLQFATAELLQNGHYRLRNLLRGRRGTEAATLNHTAGEQFVLLSGAALAPHDAGLAALGQTLLFKAMSPYQTVEDVAALPVMVAGRGLRPLPPVHMSAKRLQNNDIHLSWTRRSRQGFDWVDGADAPLAEEAELYDVEVLDGPAVRRAWRVSAPGLTYTAAEQTADFGGFPPSLAVRVAQVSAQVGRGRAAQQSFSL